jgi:Domain of unknown function (DUF4112)
VPPPPIDLSNFLLISLAILAVVGAAALAAYFVLKAVLTRAADGVATGLAQGMLKAGDRLRPEQVAQLRTTDASRRETLANLERLSRLLDSAIRLPVIGGIGLDALLGLVPVAGDVTSAALGISLVAKAVRAGAPRAVVARMVANVCVDLALGALPVVGDAADIFFRANEKNMRLLRDHLSDR